VSVAEKCEQPARVQLRVSGTRQTEERDSSDKRVKLELQCKRRGVMLRARTKILSRRGRSTALKQPHVQREERDPARCSMHSAVKGGVTAPCVTL
jgi:hypothetical protein